MTSLEESENEGKTDDLDLKQRAIRAGIWSGSSYLFTKAIQFVQNVILARLLQPSDFGLMGIAGVTLSTVHTFTHFGLDAALVQRPTLSPKALHSAWMLAIARGVVLAGFLYLSSPLLARFFDDATVEPILVVMSTVFLIDGFVSVGVTVFRRNLRFDRFL